MNTSELVDLLESHQIPLYSWGIDDAKTVKELLREINSKETVLAKTPDGLVRVTSVAMLWVYYRNRDTTLVLKEDKQVFSDGRERRRKLVASIGEKRHRNETFTRAARRALEEELGIAEKITVDHLYNKVEWPTPSVSFPGLLTQYTMVVYETFLPQHLYKPEGYVEKQENKTNYYIWTPHQIT